MSPQTLLPAAPAGLYAQPLPGVPMRPPFYPPKPGQVVVGYEYITPENNPNACDLSVQGCAVFCKHVCPEHASRSQACAAVTA